MRRFTLLSFLLVLASCGEVTEPAAPETAELSPAAPTFNFMNGPSEPGMSAILRWMSRVAYVGADPERLLVSAIDFGVEDLANSLFCGGEVPIERLSAQAVYHGGAWGVLNHKNDATLQVFAWDGTTDPFAWVCSAVPLAVGRGNFRVHYNDYYASGTGRPRLGWTAQGQLTDPATGQRVHYNENQNCFADTWECPNEDIHLRWVGQEP